MSFCPSKDIHSVYLDNELPEIYKAEYEAHVNSCAKCKAELEKLKALHEVLQHDSKNITPDSHFIDESYDRLMVKLSYSKNTGRKSENKFNLKNIGYVASAAAAAAVFALVVPMRAGTKTQASVSSATAATIAAINANSIVGNVTQSPYVGTANNVSFGSGNSMVISGNINESVLNSSNHGQKRNQAEIQNTNAKPGEIMKGIEVFRPKIDENETISIKITLPGMNSQPVTAEIQLPAEVMSGRF